MHTDAMVAGVDSDSFPQYVSPALTGLIENKNQIKLELMLLKGNSIIIPCIDWMVQNSLEGRY